MDKYINLEKSANSFEKHSLFLPPNRPHSCNSKTAVHQYPLALQLKKKVKYQIKINVWLKGIGFSHFYYAVYINTTVNCSAFLTRTEQPVH